MKEQAIIDRFEKDIAVLLFETDQEEMNVSISQLPKDAAVGTWLIVSKDRYALYPSFAIDQKKTDEMYVKTNDLMAKLRAKKGSSYRKN